MDARCLDPDRPAFAADLGGRNFEERLVSLAICGIWPVYAVGGLYLAGPMLAVALLGLTLWRAAFAGTGLAPALDPIPLGAWIWTGGMAVLLAALVAAHASESLGALGLLKASIGWMKGWGLFAVFIVAGAGLRLRPGVVVRALCWLSVQSLALMPVLVLAAFVHLPAQLFVSPLQAVGGPGPEFFAVHLYITDPASGTPRWQFFAPWAPAAGLMGDVMFAAALYEPRRWLRRAALLGAISICALTASRMAVIFLVTVPPCAWVLSRLGDRRIIGGLAVAGLVAGMAAQPLLDAEASMVAAFRGARASSSRVRDALGRIAVDRWRDEAWLFGHGVVTRGSHAVEFMPIGSHHTWYGLLYVKGIVGAAGLAAPLAWTTLELLVLAQSTLPGRLGLTLVLLLIFYTFGENLEILSYLFYPALLLIGCALGQGGRVASREPGQRPRGLQWATA